MTDKIYDYAENTSFFMKGDDSFMKTIIIKTRVRGVHGGRACHSYSMDESIKSIMYDELDNVITVSFTTNRESLRIYLHESSDLISIEIKES